MKIRVKNKCFDTDVYPTKWETLLKKYGLEKAKNEYYKFCRSFCLEKYILKYGEVDGKSKFHERENNIKRGVTLESYIDKYGKDGERKYNEWKLKVRQDLPAFIRRYGEIKGRHLFEIFKEKASKPLRSAKKGNESFNTNIEYYLKKHENQEEAEKALKNRQNTSSLEKFISKYGTTKGINKYQKANKLKAITLDNCIKKYGEIKGPEFFFQWKEKLKFSASREFYILKYGEVEGAKKYSDRLLKKINSFKDGFSLIGLDFCEKLYGLLKLQYKKIYYGKTEYKFFVNSERIKIIQPDFYIKDINFVVEFFGDYWHRNPHMFSDEISQKIREKDQERLGILKETFKCRVLVVWESDYRSNPAQTVEDVINKIKGIYANG